MTLPEIVVAMPLVTTVWSVGVRCAPPVPPERPSSWLRSAAVAPGGAGRGSEGGVLRLEIVTM